MPAQPIPERTLPESSAASEPDHFSGRGQRLVAGRYRLDSMIGHGTTGSVWAATDELLRRPVALKKINIPRGMAPSEADQLRERTLREARAAAALTNPHIVTVYDILPATETGPVIVMELLHGRSLAQIIRNEGRLLPAQAATVGVAIGSALLTAHAAGITHRDVKPANVLIDDNGMIKLSDFGIARNSREEPLTGAGLILGSPAYLAPEIVTGTPPGPASDAWSLGGLLFACVEGYPPFDAGTPMDTVAAVVNDPVPLHPHSGPLGTVVDGLLVKSPSLRMGVHPAVSLLRETADDPSGTRLLL